MLTLWKCLIQSRLDYCSQLWSPSSAADINRIENIQRSYTSCILGMKDVDYWSRLNLLNLYSQERRRERYMCIFIWKISVGLCTGYNLQFQTGGRRSRLCVVKNFNRYAPTKVRQAVESSMGVRGARIFNLLPQHLRNMGGEGIRVDEFKKELDIFLKFIPDQPTTPGQGRPAKTHSLIPMTNLQY